MISEGALRLSIRRELRDWERMMQNGFTKGVVKGLRIAERLAWDLHRQDLARRSVRLATFNRDTAAEFWRTICTASNTLLRGDYPATKRRLLKTIARYERARQIANGVFIA